MNKKIVVIGTGYVGLPAALMLAKAGFKVVGVDINKNIVKAINDGVMHIKEEELQKLMDEPAVKKNLIAQEKPCKGDAFLIAVPTPLNKKDKISDLSYVESAVKSIIPFLEPGNLIILESTVPPLTCKNLIKPMVEKATKLREGKDIFISHCPERILPGNIFYEIVHNDRIIGGMCKKATQISKDIYASFVKGHLYETDDVTAEMVKLMENTFRDVNIALANELWLTAEKLGIDIKEAIDLANKHPRVKMLKPGIGVGGHCIPIDPWFIREVDPENCTLIYTARTINDRMPSIIVSRIINELEGISNPKIIALGMAYKPDANDLRESPALEIVELLKEKGREVENYDPLIEGKSYDSIESVAKGADCIVILVEHKAIIEELEKNIDKIKSVMRNKLIIRF